MVKMTGLYRAVGYFKASTSKSIKKENITGYGAAGTKAHADMVLEFFSSLPGFTGGYLEECIRHEQGENPWWVVHCEAEEDDFELDFDLEAESAKILLGG